MHTLGAVILLQVRDFSRMSAHMRSFHSCGLILSIPMVHIKAIIARSNVSSNDFQKQAVVQILM